MLKKKMNVISEPTKPFIVNSNENQWIDSEGSLIKEVCFTQNTKIPFYHLINWLNLYYQKYQTTEKKRQLTIKDCEYFHYKLEKSSIITKNKFDPFWKWFGTILKSIKSNPKNNFVSSLWTEGYICGFVTKEEAELILKGQEFGTFLIRFSKEHGPFVISYRARSTVKHCIAKDNLEEFLFKAKELQFCLSIYFINGKNLFLSQHKNKLFKIINLNTKEQDIPGYDKTIPPEMMFEFQNSNSLLF